MDQINTYERYEFDLNSFLQEKTLIMYADDGILNDVVDTVEDIIDKTGTAGFFFVIGFNTVIWWGKIGIYVLRVFTSLKSVYKELFDW